MSEIGAKYYDQLSDHFQQKLFLDLISGIEKKSGLKFLDLGCGTGKNTKILRNLTDSNGRVIAIDPNVERIKIAREKYEGNIVSFHCASGRDLLRYASDVDVVISNAVIHWIPREEKQFIFEAVYKCLKPGGKFIFNSSLKTPLSIGKFVDKMPEKVRAKINANFFYESLEFFCELALKSGFEVEKVEAKSYDFPFNGSPADYILLMASTLCVEELDAKMTLDELEIEYEGEKLKNGNISIQSSLFIICLKKPLVC